MAFKIIAAEVWRICVPLRWTFRHAKAERAITENVVLLLTLADGAVGCGEAVPRPYVTGETAEVVVSTLVHQLLPCVLGVNLSSLDEVRAILKQMHLRGAAGCAFELALLDAVARSSREGIHSLIGPEKRSSVMYSAVIPLLSPHALKRVAQAIRCWRFRAVKMKVSSDPEENVQRLQIVREVLGPGISLRIDANGAWNPDTALAAIRRLERFRLSAVEEPVGKCDIEGLAYVSKHSPVSISVDESLATLEDAQVLAERHACHLFNIRISKCGGLFNSLRIAGIAENAGLDYQVGCQVGESSILSAAGRRLLLVLDKARFAEGSYGRLLLKHDVGRPHVRFGFRGLGRELSGPGLGSAADVTLLRRFSVQKQVLCSH